MNLALVFSDLHLHERPEFAQVTESGLNSRLEEGLNILDQIVELAIEKSVPHIIYLGDMFELKDRIPAHMLVELSYRLQQLADANIGFTCLMGNHDFKLSKYPLLKTMKNLYLIEQPERQKEFVFIPFMRDYQDFKKVWLKLHENDLKGSIICFHQELPGVWYNEKMQVEGEFDLPLQEDVLYLGGHIHIPQVVHEKINYLGSPYMTEFGEKGKRFVYFIQSDLLLVPWQLNYPKFIQVDYSKKSTSVVPFKNNYIQITGTYEPSVKQDVLDHKEFMLKRGARGVSLKVKYLLESQERLKSSSINERMVINEFLRIINTDLDKEKLETVGKELLGETI